MTVFEPNKRFATKTLTKPQVTVSYAFDEENGGTRITYKFVMITSGFMRLLEPLIAGSMKKDTDLDFEKLRARSIKHLATFTVGDVIIEATGS